MSIWGLLDPERLGHAESQQLLGMATSLMAQNRIDFDDMAAGRIATEVTDWVIEARTRGRPKLSFARTR